MPSVPHVESHFRAKDSVRDVVIGMSDGLTVPFALAAGLSGALATTSIVVTAGLAEIAAGSIAMGLGGYLAGKTDIEHYASERQREFDETHNVPEKEKEEVAEIFRAYGLPPAEVHSLVNAIAADRTRWVDFMMKFELGLEPPNPSRARYSALTIAASYIVGGLIPLAPYMIVDNLQTALRASIFFTLVALAVFGMTKAYFTGISLVRGGLQTLLTGGLAAAAAYGLARILS